MKKSEQGFTIIELVIVIAILGILGAVALPKFANLTTSARSAAFDGVKSGFTASVMIAHSKWLADGASSADSTITLEGGTSVGMNGSGWPKLDATDANQDTASELWALLMNGSVPSGWTPTEDLGAPTTATYTQTDSGNLFVYNYSTGAIN